MLLAILKTFSWSTFLFIVRLLIYQILGSCRNSDKLGLQELTKCLFFFFLSLVHKFVKIQNLKSQLK